MDCLKTSKILPMLHGISMNTGGGATKIKNVGKGGILYVKNRMPLMPPLFRLIQSVSQEEWQNMYQNFNCGVGIDVVGEDSPRFDAAMKRAAFLCNLDLYRLGHCEKFSRKRKDNVVRISSSYGEWQY